MTGKLLVGAAKADITPSKKLMPIPFFMSINFDSVYNRLYVRALEIESGDERVLFVTFDTTFIPNPLEMVSYISKVSGLDETHVFTAATHTHSAPLVGGIEPGAKIDKNAEKAVEWYGEIKNAVKEAVEKAAKNKQPAKMGFGKGKSYINVNRDYELDGKAYLGSNFERESDKTLNLLKFTDMKDKPIAFLVNYAVHGVVMNGCLVNGNMKICSDLPGTTSERIEDMYKNAVCLWTSGAAGDQNPRYMTQFEEPGNKDMKSVKNLGETGYFVLEALVNEHVRDILATEKTITCDSVDAKLSVQKTEVSCEGRTPDNVIALAKMFNKELPPPQPVSYTLRLVTVGDLAIQGISAEVVTSIGAAAMSTSPFKNTMLITHTDTYGGYVPNDWEYDHEAFEAGGTSVKKGAAEPAFVSGFAKMFGNIR